MKTLTLKIRDDYFEKIISFLEILPKKAVKIELSTQDKKLHEIESEMRAAMDDIEHGRTKKVGTIA